MSITDDIMDPRIGKPRTKVTAEKNDPLSGHKMDGNGNICLRCQEPQWRIVTNKAACISDARARGNAAIHRIIR